MLIGEEDFWDALNKNYGIFSATSKWLWKEKGIKMSRQAIYKRALNDPEALRHIRETAIDIADHNTIKFMTQNRDTNLQFKGTELAYRRFGLLNRQNDSEAAKPLPQEAIKDEDQAILDRYEQEILERHNDLMLEVVEEDSK